MDEKLNKILHETLEFNFHMRRRNDDDQPQYQVELKRKSDGRQCAFSMESPSVDAVLNMAISFLK